MPWITTILLGIILLLQYPLWLGKGSLPHLQQIDQTLQAQKQRDAELKLRNTAMEAEIQDLKRGYDAIEERARSELGMVKPHEILYQYLMLPSTHSMAITTSDKPKPASSHKARKPHNTSIPINVRDDAATDTTTKNTDEDSKSDQEKQKTKIKLESSED